MSKSDDDFVWALRRSLDMEALGREVISGTPTFASGQVACHCARV